MTDKSLKVSFDRRKLKATNEDAEKNRLRADDETALNASGEALDADYCESV